MKIYRIASVLYAACCLAVSGQEVSLQGWGTTFEPPSCEIEWRLPTNQLPQRLWVYKVAPTTFSAEVVSNVMALGGYTKKEATKLATSPFSKDVQYFQHRGESSGLSIVPRYGFILYLNEKTQRLRLAEIEGVPTEKEAQQLALAYLPKLGIQQTQLAVGEGGSELRTYATVETHGGLDRKRGEIVKKNRSCAVSFIRRLDGVDFAGIGQYGGVKLGFGNHGMVSELELVWPNLNRHNSFKLATTNQMARWILDGKTVVAPGPNSGVLLSNVGKLKKLTVSRITPLYLGSSEHELKEYIYPFAALEVTATFGDTKLAAVLNCPILGEQE